MRSLLAFLLTCFATFLVGALAFGIVVRGATPNPRVTIAPDGHTLTVLCGPRDGQPRPPFSCKDRIDQQQLDLEAIVRWWQAPPLYEPVAYDVSHANRPYAIVRATPNREPLNFKIQDAADDLNKALLMFLGILVIAKGRGSVSLPAGLFLFGIVAGSGINPSLVELPYWLVIAVHSLRQAFVSISLFCLSLVALEITDAVSRKGRATAIVLSATLNFGCVFPLLLFGSVFLPLRASEHAYSHNVAFTTLFYGLPLLAKLLPLVMLAYAVARPKPKDAGLARWILASTLIGFSGPIVKELSSTLGMHDRSLAPLVLTESVMAFGYGYALIQHHLVDVNFALVRAAVLGTIGLALSGLDQYVSEIIDDRSGLNVYRFISFVAVLAIGMSIRFIEPRLDGIFDRFAFTRRYRMQCGCARFAKTAPKPPM
ncbi:MAG: hypothetical protein IAI50_15505, partial [Candidatus Eremiobacteraeota bacterium]|nr:hypothetical protein [Candidatus Eremiobacteraeota bacterium]